MNRTRITPANSPSSLLMSPLLFRHRLSAILPVGIALTLVTTRAYAEPKHPDWNGDLAYFARELPARHKNLFFQVPPEKFRADVDALAKQAATLPDAEVVFRLQELVVGLGDDHTDVGWPEFVGGESPEYLPLRMLWFADGWRVISIRGENRNLLGAKLTTVSGVPIAEVEARLANLVSQQTAVQKARVPGPMVLPAVLRHYGLAKGDKVTFEGTRLDGKVVSAEFSLKDDTIRGRPRFDSFPPKAVALGLKDTRSILWSTILAEDRIFYAQYNRCDGREVAERLGEMDRARQLPSLADLFSRLLADVKTALAAGKVDTFVFDVRHNSGGASDFGTAFAQKLAQVPELKRKGAVYVIVGRRTFSSAILNAMDFRILFEAPVVGETPGGTPNHYGETKKFRLPSSKLEVTYSTKYFERIEGAGLKPLTIDVPAEPSFADYAAGIDRPVEEIRQRARAARAEATAAAPAAATR